MPNEPVVAEPFNRNKTLFSIKEEEQASDEVTSGYPPNNEPSETNFELKLKPVPEGPIRLKSQTEEKIRSQLTRGKTQIGFKAVEIEEEQVEKNLLEDMDRFISNNIKAREAELAKSALGGASKIKLETTNSKLLKEREAFSGSLDPQLQGNLVAKNIDNEVNLDEIEAKKSNDRKKAIFKPVHPTLKVAEEDKLSSLAHLEKMAFEKDRIGHLIKDR